MDYSGGAERRKHEESGRKHEESGRKHDPDSQGFVRKSNPLLDKNGEISKCNVCGSIYH